MIKNQIKTKQKSKSSTGIMGGSFNPFHLAHLNSLLSVKEQFSLDNIVVIPSFHTPLRSKPEENPVHRLKMLKKTLRCYPFIKVDDYEIRQKGISYTYRTVIHLHKTRKKADFFFIMGLDQFYILDRWKNFKALLRKTNLIVTSRPGEVFPKTNSDFPKGLKPLIKKRVLKEVSLKISQKKIYFCHLKDMDISSSDIRERLKNQKPVNHLLPQPIDSYIKEKTLYRL